MPASELEVLSGRLRRAEARIAQLEDWRDVSERLARRPLALPSIGRRVLTGEYDLAIQVLAALAGYALATMVLRRLTRAASV